jgi:GNAT superfamily N-acetyltransferase
MLDFHAVAALHRQSIAEGFLSTLGERFLARLYRAIAEDPGSAVRVAVAEGAGALEGFVAGTVDTRAMYRRVLGRQWLWFGLLLAPSALKPRVLRRILETMRYGRTAGVQDPSVRAELLAVAVAPGARGKGVGRSLIAGLEQFYAERGVQTYKVVTAADDPVSNAFYAACGFAPTREFAHHGNPMREYIRTCGQ